MTTSNKPNKEQLRRAICDGDDTIHNVVVLLNDGIFKVIPLEEVDQIEDMIIGRFGTLEPDFNDVGEKAALSEDYIDTVFNNLYSFWQGHKIAKRLFRKQPKLVEAKPEEY